MKRLPLLLMLLVFPALLFASGGGETDIFPRTVNFVIFAAIVYYLLADPAKKFFVNRTKGISDDLELVQQKLKESKKAKDEALAKVEEAKKKAEEIVSTAKKEAVIMSEKIKENGERDLEIMGKQYQDNMNLEKRKAEREVVKETLHEMFEDGAMKVDESALSQILLKKVA